MADATVGGTFSGAASGAAAGSVAGPWGAVAGGVIGGIGGLMGGKSANDSGRAAGRAAMERDSRARTALTQIRQYGTQAMNQSQASTEELMSYQNAISAQDRQVQRSEELIRNLDPALIEASQQALKLLRGENASVLAPMQQQRQMQRQKLLDQLRSQLGSGAETSSIGQAALQKFDLDTNSMMGQAQQGALGNLNSFLGTQYQNHEIVGNDTRTLAGLGQARGGLNQRILGTTLNAGNQNMQAWQPVIGAAGSQYAGDVYSGMAGQQQAGSLLSGLGSLSQAYGSYQNTQALNNIADSFRSNTNTGSMMNPRAQ